MGTWSQSNPILSAVRLDHFRLKRECKIQTHRKLILLRKNSHLTFNASLIAVNLTMYHHIWGEKGHVCYSHLWIWLQIQIQILSIFPYKYNIAQKLFSQIQWLLTIWLILNWSDDDDEDLKISVKLSTFSESLMTSP